MPTGYTAKLYDGEPQTFVEFVMSCARAFGATITMRDEPLSAPIPDEFAVDSWNAKALQKAERDLADVEAWTEAEAEDAARASFEVRLGQYRDSRAERERLRDRYSAMLLRVSTWQPPTPNHESLHRFMIEQLTDSIKHDTGYTVEEPTLLTGAEFRRQRLEGALRDVAYHQDQHARETERTKQRNEWIRALRMSLKECE